MKELLAVVIPLVVTAVVAGISALAKALYEKRDGRLTAQRQLELATTRTQFVSAWLDVCRTIEGEDAFVAHANALARQELEEAYADAQVALQGGKAALSHTTSRDAGDYLLTALLLRRRKRRLSYAFVALFYFVVAISIALSISYASDPQAFYEEYEMSGWDLVFGNILWLLISWPLCYGAIRRIEGRAENAGDSSTVHMPPPVSNTPDDPFASPQVQT